MAKIRALESRRSSGLALETATSSQTVQIAKI